MPNFIDEDTVNPGKIDKFIDVNSGREYLILGNKSLNHIGLPTRLVKRIKDPEVSYVGRVQLSNNWIGFVHATEPEQISDLKKAFLLYCEENNKYYLTGEIDPMENKPLLLFDSIIKTNPRQFLHKDTIKS